MGLNNINSKSTWGQAASDINTNFTTIDSDLKKVKNATTRNKGYFSTSSELISAFPTASKGDIAYVGSSYPYDIWKWNGGSWANSGSTGGEESVNLGNYHTAGYVDEKLSKLGSDVFAISSTIELDNTSENIVGTTNKGYINADANVMYFIDTDSSIMYVPANKGDIFYVKIPTTRSSGWSVAFSTSIGNGMPVEGYYKTENNEQYETNLEMPFDGYLLVVYKADTVLPTLVKSTVKSKADIISSLESDNNAIKDVLDLEIIKDENRGVTTIGYVNSDSNRMFFLDSSYDLGLWYGLVKKDEKVSVHIPRSTTNGRVISFADKVESGAEIKSWIDAPNGVEYDSEFTITDDVCFVIVCYVKSLGEPKITITSINSSYKEIQKSVTSLLGLENKLYTDGNTSFEDLEEQAGDNFYSYTNIGLVHKAAKGETFNRIMLPFNYIQGMTGDGVGDLVVKIGSSVSANGGHTIKHVSEVRNYDEFPPNGLYTIDFDSIITLEEGQYLWVYFTQRLTMKVWNANNESGTRIGMYFGGSINTYKYSTAMTLATRKGELISLNERVKRIEDAVSIEDSDDGTFDKPLITIVEDIYVPAGVKQKFYYNEFIFGNESAVDNTLNWRIETRINSALVGKNCVADEEGFTIYSFTSGDYILTTFIYDDMKNLLWKGNTNLHIFEPKPSIGKSILMLGDSWTDINDGKKGYTPYINDALTELGLQMNFIGTRDAGASGLKHEGIGGYSWATFASKPTSVRFKFYVDTMPSISNADTYSNNGSTYQLFEKGSGYITMNRIDGNTEPSGNALTRISGTGDNSITFTSWKPGGSNPLWNTTTDKLDFTHYRRDLCGLSTPLDYCNIQLGVNDSMGNLKTTKSDWKETLDSAAKVIDAILDDSPSCKILVNLVGMDAPSTTAWSGLHGISDGSKRTYQVNCYYLREYLNEMIKERADYNSNVYIGQSVLGINRWYGYLHYDAREIYCKINASEEIVTQLKSFNFQNYQPFARLKDEQGNNVIGDVNVTRYDRRGYIVMKLWSGNWYSYDQEFISKKTELPTSGIIEFHRNVDGLPMTIQFTECKQIDDKLAEHTFINATHPAIYGYRLMAYCAANQIAALM